MCTYTHDTYTPAYIHTIHTNAHMHTYIYSLPYMQIYICTYTHLHIYTHMHTCMHTDIHLHTYTDTHAYTRTMGEKKSKILTMDWMVSLPFPPSPIPHGPHTFGKHYAKKWSLFQPAKGEGLHWELNLEAWRDGSAVMNTGCSSRGPGFNPQHPHDGSQPPVTPAAGDLTPSSSLQGYHTHRMYRHTCRQNTGTPKLIKLS